MGSLVWYTIHMRTSQFEPIVHVRVEARERQGLVPSLINLAWTAGLEESVDGLYGEVDIEDGTVQMQVSKLAGEPEWTVDAMFFGGRPRFSNGYGARYVATTTVGSPEIIEALDAAAAEFAASEARSNG